MEPVLVEKLQNIGFKQSQVDECTKDWVIQNGGNGSVCPVRDKQKLEPAFKMIDFYLCTSFVIFFVLFSLDYIGFGK